MLIDSETYAAKLPRMFRVYQEFDKTELKDPMLTVRQEILKEEIRGRIRPGMRIALLVGSRGICSIDKIVLALGKTLQELGAKPFIVPAMGSHGGATAEGQAAVLASYGITPETMGMDICSSMETDCLGTVDGAKVYVDRIAHGADMIVPVGRVKPHTDFHGPIESGLCKMLTIGMGKQKGCSSLHQMGFENFPHLIPNAARLVIETMKVGFGLAIVENSYDRTFLIEAVPAERILEREPELLKIAKAKMPYLAVRNIDVLVIDEIGKDVSGAGMDPNITGRTTKGPVQDFNGAKIQRIVVKGLTEASHGNATGIGLADFILRDCEAQIDRQATAINAMSSGNPEAGRIPISVNDEREGILCALKTCVNTDLDAPKIVKIQNTLALSKLIVSEALLSEIENCEMTKVGEEYHWEDE